MATDERLTHYIEYADLVGDNGTPAISTGELASMARELQSLRASIPGGAGVKVISVDEVEKIILETEPSQLSDRGDKIWTRRMATALAERLSALDLSPADTQCCMCGKTGLSTIEGDGGTECQLEDGRWTCSEPCWEKAGGYGPDLSPADAQEGGEVDIEATAENIARHLSAIDGGRFHGPTYRAAKAGATEGLKCALYAAPSNPVISDDLVHAAQFLIERLDDFENGSLGDSIEDACRDFDGHISPALERLRAALSVKPQSGNDKP